MFDALDLYAFHYLLKHVDEGKFAEVLEKAAGQGARKTQQNTAGKSFAESVNNVAGTPKVYNIFTDKDKGRQSKS